MNNQNKPGRPRATSHPVDINVGVRIRAARQRLAMSQHKLADYLGITFQQVQKYEKGSNRVSASRLVDLAVALEVDVSFFFGSPIDAAATTVQDLAAYLHLLRPRFREIPEHAGEEGRPLLWESLSEVGRAPYLADAMLIGKFLNLKLPGAKP